MKGVPFLWWDLGTEPSCTKLCWVPPLGWNSIIYPFFYSNHLDKKVSFLAQMKFPSDILLYSVTFLIWLQSNIPPRESMTCHIKRPPIQNVKLSPVKPYNKTSCKWPNLTSDCSHFLAWWFGSIPLFLTSCKGPLDAWCGPFVLYM